MVFVFATGTMMNASTTLEKNNLVIEKDCFSKAWEYGTANGGGDAELEYALTDAYYAGCIS